MNRSYHYSFAAIITLACAAVAAFGRAVSDAIDRSAAFVWGLAPVDLVHRDVLTFDALPIGLVGYSPFDPALQQSLRHEAGLPRRSADRHT